MHAQGADPATLPADEYSEIDDQRFMGWFRWFMTPLAKLLSQCTTGISNVALLSNYSGSSLSTQFKTPLWVFMERLDYNMGLGEFVNQQGDGTCRQISSDSAAESSGGEGSIRGQLRKDRAKVATARKLTILPGLDHANYPELFGIEQAVWFL